jgi:predicted Fe-Mo cluster-binding NifX family protein
MTALPSIGAPATSALASAGITTLELVAGRPANRLLAMHGVGPRAIRILQEALASNGLDPLT